MIITFSGPSSSGKTTIFEMLKVRYPEYYFISEISRDLWEYKWKFRHDKDLSDLVENGDISKCMDWNRDNLVEFKGRLNYYVQFSDIVTIFDRGPIDGLIYTILFSPEKTNIFFDLVNLALDINKMIDKTIVFEAIPNFDDDNFRTKYQRELEIKLFKNFKFDYFIPYTDKESRFNMVRDIILS